jgi:hypothetical protein
MFEFGETLLYALTHGFVRAREEFGTARPEDNLVTDGSEKCGQRASIFVSRNLPITDRPEDFLDFPLREPTFPPVIPDHSSHGKG